VLADLQSAYWTLPSEVYPKHVTAPFVSPSFCFDDGQNSLVSLRVHLLCTSQQQSCVDPAHRSVMHWLNRIVQFILLPL
jgi:hypothetical protein